RVAFRSNHPDQDFQQDRQDGVLNPNTVKLADLNGDGIADLVVANGGGNNVLVYLGVNGGGFSPAHTFFAGTNPTGLTSSDLNGAGMLDLVVANQGSNDISILFGHGQGESWTLMPGPRLRAGLGPTATVVQDVNGDGLLDILVANSASNNVFLLPGVGG